MTPSSKNPSPVVSPELELETLRHSTAHVLAMAVQRLWKGTQVTIGPVIKDGFYYDFAFPPGIVLSENDLPKIEKEMRRIIKLNLPVVRKEYPRAECRKIFEDLGEFFKCELIDSIPEDETLSVYEIGDWQDLCRGPHVNNTNKIKAFKLLSLAGSYWRGDESKASLTRVYGTAWKSEEDLKAYLDRLEEARKRDHRVLGKQLDFFSFHGETPANPFFHPKGAFVINQMIAYMRKSNQHFGFDEVSSPLIMDVSMWKKSGHYDNYRENMYFTKVDEDDHAVKPMNCPGHCLIFSNKRHSYRDLPIRYSEFGRVHRHERSGVTHGLFRVRSFVQDDAHVFCTEQQLEAELAGVIAQIAATYQDLGFSKFRMELSTRPSKSIGSDEIWKKAEDVLQSVLVKTGREFKLNPGDGAFYGPKIDFHLIDSLERSWQCATVQLDFSMPARFELSYQTPEDQKATPVMIHRAVYGSLERFFGILIEHYAGRLPLWLAPVQVQIVTVSERQVEYAKKVHEHIKSRGVRAYLEASSEKLGYKIRAAQMLKVPFMIVIGDNEVEAHKISPRAADGTQWELLSCDEFVDKIQSDLDLPNSFLSHTR